MGQEGASQETNSKAFLLQVALAQLAAWENGGCAGGRVVPRYMSKGETMLTNTGQQTKMHVILLLSMQAESVGINRTNDQK